MAGFTALPLYTARGKMLAQMPLLLDLLQNLLDQRPTPISPAAATDLVVLTSADAGPSGTATARYGS
jgi:hypothetical protein